MKRKSLMMLILTMVAFAILVKLGLWQLDRADEKRQLMALLESRSETVLTWPLNRDDVRGFRFQVEAKPQPAKSLLLDNQIQDGRVGYRWLLPAEVDGASTKAPLIIVDMGFVPAGPSRTKLPILPAVPEQIALSGRLYQPSENRLNSALLPEGNNPTRIQALEWAELEKHMGYRLVHALLMLEQPAEIGFSPRWQPINLSPEKHQGYALQWFGLALGLLAVVGVICRRAWLAKQSNTERDCDDALTRSGHRAMDGGRK